MHFLSGPIGVHGAEPGDFLVVDIPNACATLWLPTDIFAFDVMPGADGPIKHVKGGVDIPMSPDK